MIPLSWVIIDHLRSPVPQARTELVALMDVDMLVSSKMAKFMRGRRRAETMVQACRQKVGDPALLA